MAWAACPACAGTARAEKFDGLTKAQIGRRVGISRERARQLIARGESVASILAGTYHKRPGRPPSKRLAHLHDYRCGACGELGHNRRTCRVLKFVRVTTHALEAAE